MALVTVVLPTFNRAATITRAIDSVLAQTYEDLELLIVDDGSTDSTRHLVERYTDPRLHFIQLSEQAGAAAARNVGARQAMGSVLAFQDSDDEWLPQKLELQLALLAPSPEVGWVGGRHRVVTPDETWDVSPTAVIARHDHRRELLDGRAFVTPTWLVRRAVFESTGGFREDMPCLEDWDLIFRLDDITRFAAVDEVVLIRHASQDSLFGDPSRRVVGLEMTLASHGHRWRDYPADLAERQRDLGRLHAEVGSKRKALRSYLQAAKSDPRRWRTYGAIVKRMLAK